MPFHDTWTTATHFLRHIQWTDDLAAVCPLRNAAARLVSGALRYDHITPVLQQLHLFPVRKRVDFKMATLVYLYYKAERMKTWCVFFSLSEARINPVAGYSSLCPTIQTEAYSAGFTTVTLRYMPLYLFFSYLASS